MSLYSICCVFECLDNNLFVCSICVTNFTYACLLLLTFNLGLLYVSRNYILTLLDMQSYVFMQTIFFAFRILVINNVL